MQRLTDTELVETYYKAKEARCSEDFLFMLLTEIENRGITLDAVS